MIERFIIQFTLPQYDGKWIELSGNNIVFDTLDKARKRCKKFGAIYFTCGESVQLWCHRIINMDTKEIIEYHHEFDGLIKGELCQNQGKENQEKSS